MQFLSDNAAPVHPRLWDAMRAADAPDTPYDTDALSRELDARFTALFGRECAALWVATGTAANCLALATMVEPHGGVICHAEAHIEMDECGAPGFYLHGAKLLLADGEGAKVTPESVAAVLAGITRGVHQVPAQALSITQASESGLAYRPAELAALAALTRQHRLGLHMDGARFANAVAFLGCSPAAAAGPVDALSFGCVKNGGMGAEAVLLFDVEQAQRLRYRRKRAGHLQSKGRFLAAQILAMLDDDLWLDNARAANSAAALVAEGAGERLVHPQEINELFVAMTAPERAALREQGFSFYDWDDASVRLVTHWATDLDDARALGTAIARL
ncbi:low specificity L-threonine aldolase [Erythrobacter arachoides]|uniref:Low specificity L-threonine aldolase n=1 Tax=Aurantiacibacter arachoides TaxID=1850444 RepID=A0A845A727_9SPHN|nr:beta-eliminating lyase-related protein [Aurantiacibacter arachoides]MXO94727.1 low specificity L-threonine aldolase [Aurantiacibacter arachoides]GGD61123.1 L-threonine aldolase [Aurantiacibacter arachoides]